MADYKRLVSYIYNYENGIKRNNVGYARVEARNGQCKCTINISAPSLNDRQLKAYMFKRGKNGLIGILLGTLQIRNGMCEYKVLTNSQNVMNSGISLDEIGGIIVYLNDKKYYGTEWDDMPLDMDVVSTIENDRKLPQAPEGKMEEKPLERREEKYEKEREERPLERRGEKREEEREERPFERRGETYEKELEERPLERREERYKEGPEERPIEKREEKHEPMYEERPGEKRETKPEMEDDLLGSRNPERDRWEDLNTEKYFGKRPESKVTEPEVTQPKVTEPKVTEPKVTEPEVTQPKVNGPKVTEPVVTGPKVMEPISNKQGNEVPGVKKEEDTTTPMNDNNNSNVQGTHFDECEEYKKGFHYTNGCNLAEGYPKTEFDEHPIAKRLYMEYPRMFPFDDNEIAWCVKIEPQDIGLLPMDTWVLGNNSFLLHGYYSYRHLIFARVNDMSGYYYIIGVPGTFHNREKFMAKMFGFENFKCVKKPDRRTGEFGYWYVPITLK